MRSFQPRAFPLRSLISIPHHGPAGEDRWAGRRGAWALCDGASEGYDGAGWARCLARSLVSSDSIGTAVQRARAAYQPSLAPSPGQAADRGRDWLREMGEARGSWSTALLVRVSRLGGYLRAEACGDTVLFVRDGYDTVCSFPIDDADAFNQSPALVADRDGEDRGEDAFSSVTILLGGLRRPSLVLASDALAARVLSSHGAERRALWAFLAAAGKAELSSWAEAEQAGGRLRADDLTMLELAP
jgi:hypothetical protein